jgi:hypothetical protein
MIQASTLREKTLQRRADEAYQDELLVQRTVAEWEKQISEQLEIRLNGGVTSFKHVTRMPDIRTSLALQVRKDMTILLRRAGFKVIEEGLTNITISWE